MAGVSTLSVLPANTVRLIGSTQVITSVYSVIKELIENSLDAESTQVDVKLENFGLDRIEIRDNGKGICSGDLPFVAKRHYTSKIASHADLERLTSYGFRGEALASLCSVAEVSITTKTLADDVSMTYTVTSSGEILNGKPSHLGNGTLIVASNLFKNLPVRKHYYNTSKKKKEELKKIDDLLISFGVICPRVRLTFRHNKDMVLQKNAMPDVKAAMFSLLGRSVAMQLEFKHVEEVDPNLDITMFLPKPGSDILVTSRTSSDRSFLFVNSRPVTIKEIEKLVRTYYCNSYGCDNNRHPIFVVSVTVPPNEIDVNVDPNKTTVMLHQRDAVKSCLEKVLLYLYGPLDTARSWRHTNKDTENLVQEDNPEARALVSQYSRQESEEADNTTRSEQSSVSVPTVTNHSRVSKPSSRSDIPTRPNDRKVTDSNLVLQPDSEVDISAASWKIDLADYEQSQPVIESSKKSVSNIGHMSRDDGKVAVEMGHRSEGQICSDKGMVNKDKEQILTSEKQVLEGDKIVETDVFSGSDNDISDTLLDDLMETFAENQPCNKDIPDISFRDKNQQCSRMTIIKNNQQNRDNTETDTQPGDNLSEKIVLEIADNCDLTLLKAKDPKLSAADDVGSTLTGSGSNVEREDGEAWSRGHSVLVNGKLAQPVTLLSTTPSNMPSKRPGSPLTDDILPPEKRRSSGNHQSKVLLPGQTTLYDIIDDHLVQRESGFNVFTKDVRSDVVEQNPCADVEEINLILRDRWKNLTENERLKYTSLVNNRNLKSPSTPKMTSRNTKFPSTPKDMSRNVKKKLDKGRSIRDQLLSQMKKSSTKKKLVEKPTRDIIFSLSKLQDNYLSGFKQISSQSPCKKLLVGCLRTCGAWVCSRGTELLLVNPHRIAETILYHRMLEQHQLSADHLDKTVTLSASMIGGDSLWQTLISLAEHSWSCDPRVYIKDERIVGNGLKIECHRANESGEIIAELVGVSKHVPLYGVKDLSEILELITNTGATTLCQSRPLKVINYLKSEAVRMARQAPAQRGREDMMEMFSQMDDVLPSACTTCLHNKPFFHTLYDIHQVSGDDTLLGTQTSQE